MRHRFVLLLPLIAACEPPGPVRVGVVVSEYPSAAGSIAVEDHMSAGGDSMEAVIPLTPTPVAAGVALELAGQMAADPSVLAVVGHANSAASLAASQIYNRVGLVQIAPTTTAPVYDDAGPYSFRMVPGDDRQAAFVATMVREDWGDTRRIAAIYVNDDYGRGFYRALRPQLDSVVFEGVYGELADTTHLLQLIDEIVAARPDVLIWVGRPLRLRVVLQPVMAALPGLRAVCGDACDDSEVYDNVHGHFTGLRFVRFTDPYGSGSELEAMQRRYFAETATIATSEALLTYDAVRVVGAAVNSGARTRDEVRRYLESLGRELSPHPGLTGPIMFDSAGSVVREYHLAEAGENGVRAIPPRGR